MLNTLGGGHGTVHIPSIGVGLVPLEEYAVADNLWVPAKEGENDI
jgi:hypothetical protein